MASFTMTASILGSPVLTSRSAVATQRRFVVNAAATRAVEGDNKVNEEGSNNGRRNLMFVSAAAAVCSVAGIALADEPKNGSPEAKKKYAPVCVTMPTARVCRKGPPT
ncbi:photosystem II 5 kDa protein, chloroplastic-like [Lotus japonicus]|uniref:Photosystem II 5 kDa protein, chloroplastic n=1 Tax=Lotus japonicus TaxID=34305 RepID=I3T3F6_LOTJA|nr:photosystem II 5 kDa protein, chloroplastic-like [Lotus japonicus]AFK47048.1 unknown [Lotus japonicus]